MLTSQNGERYGRESRRVIKKLNLGIQGGDMIYTGEICSMEKEKPISFFKFFFNLVTGAKQFRIFLESFFSLKVWPSPGAGRDNTF